MGQQTKVQTQQQWAQELLRWSLGHRGKTTSHPIKPERMSGRKEKDVCPDRFESHAGWWPDNKLLQLREDLPLIRPNAVFWLFYPHLAGLGEFSVCVAWPFHPLLSSRCRCGVSDTFLQFKAPKTSLPFSKPTTWLDVLARALNKGFKTKYFLAHF